MRFDMLTIESVSNYINALLQSKNTKMVQLPRLRTYGAEEGFLYRQKESH